MRHNLLILLAALAFSPLLGWLMQTHRPAAPTGSAVATAATAAPDFSFRDLSGKTHTLASYRGKTVILNFWATWCAPCLAEFPRLLDVAAGRDIVLIALAQDEDPKAIQVFLKRLDQKRLRAAHAIIGQDKKGELALLFQTLLLPETIVVDRQGLMRGKITGGSWTLRELQDLVNSPSL